MRRVTGTIHSVLDRLRADALDERDKGSKFEQLIRAYLTTDPEWTARFSDVWLWSDWPERAGRPDTGIDLVAANASTSAHTGAGPLALLSHETEPPEQGHVLAGPSERRRSPRSAGGMKMNARPTRS